MGFSDPQFSPDGNKIAVIITKPNIDNNRYNADLMIIDLITGKKRILAYPVCPKPDTPL